MTKLHRVLLAAALIAPQFCGAQIVTNWVAYNDHRPGPAIPPHVPTATNWGTSIRATTLDMGAPGDTTGVLTNFLNGQALPASVTFTRTGSPDDFGSLVGPGTNTPAGQLFFGVCDLANAGIVGVDAVDNDFVTITFNNLNPEKRYVFRGTSGRGGGYAPRWTVATITADGWIDAHISGSGPGVITSNNFPANLAGGQAAWNSGHNVEGSVVGWDFITPAADGSFSITCKQYVGPTPGGAATDASYGYSFAAMLLAEVEVAAPLITTNPVVATTVEQNRPFRLSVAATGTPLLYQWYKQGSGPIAGATFPNYSVAQAALADSGSYYVVVYNPLASVTSTVAQINVAADTNAPKVAAIYSYPSVAGIGLPATLDQIVVEYDEPVQAASVSSTSSYLVPGGGNPTSVTITNDRTVVLTLASPLTEDTDYTVTVTGATDVVGNAAGSASAAFHSWVSGPGNGLLFEAFSAGVGVEVTTLTSSTNYPANPFLRTNLPAFDSRLVFPDNTQGEYGTRVRGVFIPPVSGNWVFFLRTYDRGVVSLNPHGLDPQGAQEILRESTGNEPRNWDKFTSAPFFLRGGQGYYIESLQKADAGTGADVIKVAARLAGSGFPLPVDSLNTDVDANALAGAAIAFPLAPRDLGGPLSIIQDIQNLSVEENHLATFAPQIGNPSGLPLTYKWFRDGVEIPGATGPAYSLRAVSADSGSTFRVEIAKIGSETNSRTATLTVVPDITGPVALSASSSYSNLSVVVVRFNELLDAGLAAEPGNYDLAGSSLQPSVQPDGMTVALALQEPLVQSSSYQLQLFDLRDVAGNAIVPNPTIITFTAGADQPGGNAPSLKIIQSETNVVLSWPAAVPGFTIQSTPVLPATNWTTVGTIVVTGSLNTVTLPIEAGQNRYFRLARP